MEDTGDSGWRNHGVLVFARCKDFMGDVALAIVIRQARN